MQGNADNCRLSIANCRLWIERNYGLSIAPSTRYTRSPDNGIRGQAGQAISNCRLAIETTDFTEKQNYKSQHSFINAGIGKWTLFAFFCLILVSQGWAGPISIKEAGAEQWPEPNQYGYEGWIKTQWGEGFPFNKYCPIDAGNGDRSLTGGAATASAQIMNYWKYPQAIRFADENGLGGDSYDYRSIFLNPPAVVTINIDDDANIFGFPSFGQLNAALANVNYSGSENEEAYLCFAAGIKHGTAYSAGGSGAAQDAGAYRNLGYGSARRGEWAKNQSSIISNIKNGWPVQILVTKADGSEAGHSIIADGYKSTGEFHINMGWGGTGNGWYFLPEIQTTWPNPEYDTVSDVIYDICPYYGWSQYGGDEKNTFGTTYPVPASEPQEKWSVTIPAESGGYAYNGPLIVGSGGRVYCGFSSVDQAHGNHPYIHIINKEGTREGSIVISDSNFLVGSLAQNKGGDIYFVCAYGTKDTHNKTIVYKIAAGTNEPAAIFTHNSPDAGWPDEVMKIDKSDNIYFTIRPVYTGGGGIYHGSTIYSCNRNGNLRWQRYLGDKNQVYGSFCAVDETRGQVYVICKNVDSKETFLFALSNTDGALRFTFKFSDITSANYFTTPAIGEDGTIYVGQYTKLYAFTPTLAKKWTEKDFSPAYLNNNIAIGKDGTLYLAAGKMVEGVWRPGYVRAINPADGNIKWEFEAAPLGENDSTGDVYVGSNGIVLVSYRYLSGEQRLAAVGDMNSYGEKLWDIAIGGAIAFGAGNTVYTVPSGENNVIRAFSIGDRGDPEGLAMAFLNNNPPNRPSNPTPLDGDVNKPLNIDLSWTCSAPDGHDLWYDLFLGKSNGAIGPIATYLTSTSYTVNWGLEPNCSYSWKIVATDGQAVTQGPTWVFSTRPPRAIRTVKCYAAGVPANVTIDVEPNVLTGVYTVEDTPPEGWVVSDINEMGSWDSQNKKVKWGPFSDNKKRKLTYKATAPEGSNGCKRFYGEASFDGLNETICGDREICECLTHPADTNFESCLIISEATAYGACWKTGCAWPIEPHEIAIDYITLAGNLWKFGECYDFNGAQQPPMCWVPRLSPVQESGVQTDFNVYLQTLNSNISYGFEPCEYVPQETIGVCISVRADIETQVYAVEDSPPEGWMAANINEGGFWDSINKKVKWGLFFDNQARTLCYEATPPISEAGTKTFLGIYSADGSEIVVKREINECVPKTWYRDDDGDGFGNPANNVIARRQPSGYVLNSGDCNDGDAGIYPEAAEICDGRDNDCDGQIDEGAGAMWYRDADGDEYGNFNISIQACSRPSGYVSNNTDCNDGDAGVHPGASEFCDGKDNNCDGQIDEGLGQIWCRDADGDGFGNQNNSKQACSKPSGYISDSSDCNDGDANIHPGGTEICDGQDNDCDGQTDEVCGGNLWVHRCAVKAGKETNDNKDYIGFSGMIDATQEDFNSASDIRVNIGGIYLETIPASSFHVKSGKYSYSYKIPKSQEGRITFFVINTNTRKFSLKAQKVNLTCLNCPFDIKVEMNKNQGIDDVNETLVNGRKFIPVQLMSNCEDYLQVKTVKIKSYTSADSLYVKGGISLGNPASAIGDVNLCNTDLSLTFGGQTFTIPAATFKSSGRRGYKYVCKNVKLADGGIANAAIDYGRWSFSIKITNTKVNTKSGRADVKLNIGSFNEQTVYDLGF